MNQFSQNPQMHNDEEDFVPFKETLHKIVTESTVNFVNRDDIDLLTEVAKDEKDRAHIIGRIFLNELKSPYTSEKKLGVLYAMDSMIKNVQEPYISEFLKFLPSSFVEILISIKDLTILTKYVKLFTSWQCYFPPDIFTRMQTSMLTYTQKLEKEMSNPASTSYTQPIQKPPQIMQNVGLLNQPIQHFQPPVSSHYQNPPLGVVPPPPSNYSSIPQFSAPVVPNPAIFAAKQIGIPQQPQMIMNPQINPSFQKLLQPNPFIIPAAQPQIQVKSEFPQQKQQQKPKKEGQSGKRIKRNVRNLNQVKQIPKNQNIASLPTNLNLQNLQMNEQTLKALLSQNPKLSAKMLQEISQENEIREGLRILYDSFTEQCMSCGLRFNDSSKLQLHIEKHAAINTKRRSNNVLSRAWYKCADDWASGPERDLIPELETFEAPEAIFFNPIAATSGSNPSSSSEFEFDGVLVGSSSNFNVLSPINTPKSNNVFNNENTLSPTSNFSSQMEKDSFCPVCCEKFDIVQNKNGELLYKDTIRHKDSGRIVHKDCLKTYDEHLRQKAHENAKNILENEEEEEDNESVTKKRSYGDLAGNVDDDDVDEDDEDEDLAADDAYSPPALISDIAENNEKKEEKIEEPEPKKRKIEE